MAQRASMLVFGLVAACAFGCSSGEGAPSDGSPYRVIAALTKHPAYRAVRSSGGTQFLKGANGFFESSGRRPRARVVLAPEASGAMTLSSHDGSLAVTTLGARSDSAATAAGGFVVYPNALVGGAHIVHRPLASGGDDQLIYFDKKPPTTGVSYLVKAPTGIAAVVLRGNEIHAVNSRGRTVFQMRKPWMIDATGGRHAVTASLSNCDPQSLRRNGECRMSLFWNRELQYPAVLDPEWEPTGAMMAGRLSHTATRLDDGRVLVAGGMGWDAVNETLFVTADAEIYHPSNGTWTPTGAMNAARSSHSAMLLPDGKVLVTGGRDMSASLSSAELFDPDTDTWTATDSMADARSGHDMIEAWDWAPLAVGGWSGSTALDSAETLDPTTSQWRAVGSLGVARGSHRLVELAGKQILAISGRNNVGWTDSVELYDPATEAWSSFASLGTARIDHTATRMRDGRILVVGGVDSSNTKLASSEIIEPTGMVSAGPDMTSARYGHTATLLQSGKVLVVGGECETDTCTEYSEEYDPTLNLWETPVSIYQHPAMRFHTSTILNDGKVLNAGGYNFSASPTVDATYSNGSIYNAASCKPLGEGGGVVVGSVAGAPSTFDLTSEGATDWTYEIDGFTYRKYGANLIGALSDMGAPTKSSYSAAATTYSWTDGDPDPSRVTDNTTGFAGLLGDGYSLTLPAGPELWTAKLHLGALSGSGLLHVEFSNNSCATFETVILDPSREVSLVYSSPSSSDVLNVRFTLLEAGELAAEGMSVAPAPAGAMYFETDTDPSKTDFTVTLDNPLSVSSFSLENASTLWGGTVPEQIDVNIPAGFVNYNVDFSYAATGGEGIPNLDGTGPTRQDLWTTPFSLGRTRRGLLLAHLPLQASRQKDEV